MSLYDDLIAALPNEVDAINYAISLNQIVIQNDSDDLGDFIAVWDFAKPLPKGFKVGK